MMKKRKQEELENAILRIQKMERYLDEILEKKAQGGERSAEIRENLKVLETYYTGDQWLEDFERDERGELPADLKRGVLAEDTLYDLLTEMGK